MIKDKKLSRREIEDETARLLKQTTTDERKLIKQVMDRVRIRNYGK